MEEKEDALHKSTIDRWSRKLARMEDDFESGKSNLKKYLKAAIGNSGSESRQNIARELINARKNNPSNLKAGQEGFGVMKEDEVITGMERMPWERE